MTAANLRSQAYLRCLFRAPGLLVLISRSNFIETIMNFKYIFHVSRSIPRVFGLTLMILFITSCSEEFLDVVPQDRIDKTTFYSTDSQVIIGVNGAYASLRGDYGNLNLF